VNSSKSDTKITNFYERIRTFFLIGLILAILIIFIGNRVSLFIATPPSHGVDYSQYPWYLIPFYYIVDYLKAAWISLLFAFILGGIIREFVPQEWIKKYLRKNRFSSYVLAALMAPIFITCSCSVVPIYVGFLVAGASLGVVMTFF